MKKYVAGIGLLLAALILFGCKNPPVQTLGNISAHETVTVTKDEFDGASYKFNGQPLPPPLPTSRTYRFMRCVQILSKNQKR